MNNEIQFRCGTYHGELRNNIPHGKGSFSCYDYTYNGYFVDGVFEGYGELIADESWSGEAETFLYNSKGDRLFSDGIYYMGDFVAGVPNGNGLMKNADQFQFYEGSLLDGLPHGKGKCIFYNQRCYDGHWLNGKANGDGIYIWEDGTLFEGHWTEDLLYVEDGYISIYGDVYKGDLLDGVPHGRGCLIKAMNESTYEGEFVHGQYSGYGKYRYNLHINHGKHTYEGTFLNGKYHGKGKYVNESHHWSYEGDILK